MDKEHFILKKTSTRDLFFYQNTLCCLLKALERKYTCIDLRDEACVTGLIRSVDGNMNVEMEEVVFYNPRGEEHRFNDFFVHGRNIRYVHIPKRLSALELMEGQLQSFAKSKTRPKAPRTFKQLRAKRYNQEIMHNLKNQPGPSSHQ